MTTSNPETAALPYRKVLKLFESAKGDAKTSPARQRWQGEGALYEIAFGEPY